MSPVDLDRADDVGVITVDHPPVNALSTAVRAGIAACLDAALSDRDIRSIVLCCAGRTFIAGADIREFDQPPAEPFLPEVVSRLEASDKPIVAALHGTALGGGLEVAMGCHYRIARRDARVGLPEVKLGLLPGAGGTQRLPRLAGATRALDMMLSGDALPAAAALEAGIVDRIVDGDLRTAAIDYAREVAALAPRRVRELSVAPVEPAVFEHYRSDIARKARGLVSPHAILRLVEMSTSADFDAACAEERKAFSECRATPQSAGLRHAFFAERAVSRVPGIEPGTPARPFDGVAVLGAGTMGAGIAYACLSAGLAVHLVDAEPSGLARGKATIDGLFAGSVQRGRIGPAAMQEGLARLSSGTDPAGAGDADLVIEAVFENMAIKKELFRTLDGVCKPGAVLATNTSTLDLDEIASATSRAADVVGLHFFSPAHVMRLIEIVRGARTSPDVIATGLALAKRLGKIGVVVGNGFGFVGNRMLYGYGRETQFLLLEGAAPEYIDRVLYDWGMAMGPNAVGDLAGLDVGYKARRERRDLPDDPRYYRVADLLVEMGRFGQKTGKGMYRYAPGSREPLPDPQVTELLIRESARLGVERRDIGADEVIDRCICALITEGARILEEGIASRAGDIDVIWINGYGFPRHRGGPMHYADSVGLDRLHARICEFRERHGAQYWEPPRLLTELARSGGKFADVAAS